MDLAFLLARSDGRCRNGKVERGTFQLGILFLSRPLLLMYYELETLKDIGNKLCNTIRKH